MGTVSDIGTAKKKSIEERILDFIVDFEAITEVNDPEYMAIVVSAYINALKINEYYVNISE